MTYSIVYFFVIVTVAFRIANTAEYLDPRKLIEFVLDKFENEIDLDSESTINCDSLYDFPEWILYQRELDKIVEFILEANVITIQTNCKGRLDYDQVFNPSECRFLIHEEKSDGRFEYKGKTCKEGVKYLFPRPGYNAGYSSNLSNSSLKFTSEYIIPQPLYNIQYNQPLPNYGGGYMANQPLPHYNTGYMVNQPPPNYGSGYIVNRPPPNYGSKYMVNQPPPSYGNGYGTNPPLKNYGNRYMVNQPLSSYGSRYMANAPLPIYGSRLGSIPSSPNYGGRYVQNSYRSAPTPFRRPTKVTPARGRY